MPHSATRDDTPPRISFFKHPSATFLQYLRQLYHRRTQRLSLFVENKENLHILVNRGVLLMTLMTLMTKTVLLMTLKLTGCPF